MKHFHSLFQNRATVGVSLRRDYHCKNLSGNRTIWQRHSRKRCRECGRRLCSSYPPLPAVPRSPRHVTSVSATRAPRVTRGKRCFLRTGGGVGGEWSRLRLCTIWDYISQGAVVAAVVDTMSPGNGCWAFHAYKRRANKIVEHSTRDLWGKPEVAGWTTFRL